MVDRQRESPGFNQIKPDDPYDIRKSMIQHIDNNPPIFMGNKLSIVCLLQSAEIERLTRTNKFHKEQIEKEGKNRHSYQTQIKQLMELKYRRQEQLNELKKQNSKLKDYNRRQNEQLELQKKKRSNDDQAIRIENEYKKVLTELTIVRQQLKKQRIQKNKFIQEINILKNKIIIIQQKQKQKYQNIYNQKLQNEIKTNNFHLESQINQMKSEIIWLHEQLNTKNQEIQSLLKKNQIIEKQYREIKNNLSYNVQQTNIREIRIHELQKKNQILHQKTQELHLIYQKFQQNQRQLKIIKQRLIITENQKNTLTFRLKTIEQNRVYQEEKYKENFKETIMKQRMLLDSKIQEIQGLKTQNRRLQNEGIRYYQLEDNMKKNFKNLQQKMWKIEEVNEGLNKQIEKLSMHLRSKNQELKMFERRLQNINILQIEVVEHKKQLQILRNTSDNEMRYIKQENDRLKIQNEKLKNIIDDQGKYLKQIDSYKMQNGNLKIFLDRIQHDKTIQKQNFNQLIHHKEGEIISLSQEIRQIRNQNIKNTQQTTEYKKRVNNINEQIHRLQDLITKKNYENQNLNRQNLKEQDRIRKQSKQIETKIISKLEIYQNRYEQIEKQKQSYSEKLVLSEQRFKSLQNKLQTTQNNFINKERQIQTYIRDKKQSQTNILQQQKQMSLISQEFQRDNNILKNKNIELQRIISQKIQNQQEISRKNMKIQQLERRNQELKNNYEDLQKRIINLQRDEQMKRRNEDENLKKNTELMRQNERLMKNISQIQRKIDEEENIKGQLRRSKQSLVRITEENNRHLLEIQNLRKQILNFENQNQNINRQRNQYQMKIKNMMISYQKLEEKNRIFESKVHQSQKYSYQIENYKRKISQYERIIEKANSDKNISNRSIGQYQKNIDKLMNEKTMILRQKSQYEGLLRQKSQKNEQLRRQLNEQVKKIQILQSKERSHSEERMRNYQLQIQNLDKQLHEKIRIIQQIEQTLKKKQRQFGERDNKRNYQFNIMNNNIEQLKRQISFKDEKNKSINSNELNTLKRIVEDQQNQIKDYKIRIDKYQQYKNQSKVAQTQWNTQRNDYEIQLTNIRSAFEELQSLHEHTLCEKEQLFEMSHQMQDQLSVIRLSSYGQRQMQNIEKAYRQSKLKLQQVEQFAQKQKRQILKKNEEIKNLYIQIQYNDQRRIELINLKEQNQQLNIIAHEYQEKYRLNNQHNQSTEYLHNSIHDLQNKLNKQKSKNQRLELQIISLKEQCNELKKVLDKQNTDYNTKNKIHNQYASLQNSHQIVLKKLDEFQQYIYHCQNKITHLQIQNKRLKQQNHDLMMKFQKNEDLIFKNQQLSQQNDKLYAQINLYKRQIEVLRLKVANYSSLEKRTQEFLALMVVLFAQIDSLRIRLLNSQKQYQQMQRKSLQPLKIAQRRRES